MEHIIRIHKNGKVIEKQADSGTNLLKFMRKNSFEVNASCGGHGSCGKCKVKVEGLPQIKSEKEKKLLGSKAIEKGYRLACYNLIKGDMDIYLDNVKEEAKIMTKTESRKVKFLPVIKKEYLEFNKPTIEDQKSDYERLMQGAAVHKAAEPLELLRNLPEVLREDDFKVTLGLMDKKLIFVESGDTTKKLYGVAIDIGTTTIAAYLYDLNSGEKIDVYSLLNPQRKFGADVLSRIDYSLASNEALDEMNSVLIQSINGVMEQFCTQNGIVLENIYSVVFVGNTTMMHFLLKIPAKNIALAPFISVTTEMIKVKAQEIGLHINSFGYAILLPSVSAYIGADTVGAVLSSGMYESKKVSLLVDIGTNGEIVLGNSEYLYACSTAAGPAFEGANIRNGVGGITGAIDKVTISSDVQFTTIENASPVGLCGSGIVDVIAGMLSTGIIDETGRIDSDNTEIKPKLLERIKIIDGVNSFLLVENVLSIDGADIAITQKDIRELQNAKAAIAAGIKVLAKSADIELSQIDRVFLAGGFGSYINIDSALKIGLIPNELKGKIKSIGNAAGAGAIEGLISTKMLKKAVDLKRKIKYVELSSRADFVSEYVECMMFE